MISLKKILVQTLVVGFVYTTSWAVAAFTQSVDAKVVESALSGAGSPTKADIVMPDASTAYSVIDKDNSSNRRDWSKIPEPETFAFLVTGFAVTRILGRRYKDAGPDSDMVIR